MCVLAVTWWLALNGARFRSTVEDCIWTCCSYNAHRKFSLLSLAPFSCFPYCRSRQWRFDSTFPLPKSSTAPKSTGFKRKSLTTYQCILWTEIYSVWVKYDLTCHFVRNTCSCSSMNFYSHYIVQQSFIKQHHTRIRKMSDLKDRAQKSRPGSHWPTLFTTACEEKHLRTNNVINF